MVQVKQISEKSNKHLINIIFYF